MIARLHDLPYGRRFFTHRKETVYRWEIKERGIYGLFVNPFQTNKKIILYNKLTPGTFKGAEIRVSHGESCMRVFENITEAYKQNRNLTIEDFAVMVELEMI